MKPTEAAVEAYQAALPADADVEARKMFGCPAAFVNGNMFFGTFDDSVIFRLGEERSVELTSDPRIEHFAPGGRTWKAYVELSSDSAPEQLAELATAALAFTREMPAKVKKPRKKKA